MKPLIFSACDEWFGQLFGPVLKASAEANGFKCLIVSSGEWADGSSRARHSVLRYKHLPDVLKEHDRVLMVDTDTIVRRPFKLDVEFDIGLLVRGKPDPKHQINGSVVYITRDALPAAEWLRDQLAGETKWYDDQLALRELYLKNQYRFGIFKDTFIDWNLREDSPMWTGKGDVKLSDKWFAEMQRWYPESHRPMRRVA